MSENQRTPGRGLPPSTPRWVKVFMIIFIALVLLVVILHLMGFGFGSHSAGGSGGVLSRGLVGYSWLIRHAVEQL